MYFDEGRRNYDPGVATEARIGWVQELMGGGNVL